MSDSVATHPPYQHIPPKQRPPMQIAWDVPYILFAGRGGTIQPTADLGHPSMQPVGDSCSLIHPTESIEHSLVPGTPPLKGVQRMRQEVLL